MRWVLGETIKEFTVARRRLLEAAHHFAADAVQRRNDVFEVELQRLFQNVPLRLAIALGYGHELFVELGIDLGSELLRGWHGKRLSTSILADWGGRSR